MKQWRSTENALKRVHDASVGPRRDHKRHLEEELATEYRELHSSTRRWMMMFDLRTAQSRWILSTLAVVLLGVGACATPTTTEVNMGKQLSFQLDDGAQRLDPGDIAGFVDARPGVDEVSVNLREFDGRAATLDLYVWGTDVDGNGIARDLEATFPALAGASVEVADLTGEIRESFAQKVGRRVFKLELSGNDAEAIRAQFLEQLAAQGLTGDAKVTVDTDGGVSTIGIELTAEGEGYETEDVIELITDGDPGTIEIGDDGQEITTETSIGENGETIVKKKVVKKQ